MGLLLIRSSSSPWISVLIGLIINEYNNNDLSKQLNDIATSLNSKILRYVCLIANLLLWNIKYIAARTKKLFY